MNDEAAGEDEKEGDATVARRVVLGGLAWKVVDWERSIMSEDEEEVWAGRGGRVEWDGEADDAIAVADSEEVELEEGGGFICERACWGYGTVAEGDDGRRERTSCQRAMHMIVIGSRRLTWNLSPCIKLTTWTVWRNSWDGHE
jgi:hypothetical protein